VQNQAQHEFIRVQKGDLLLIADLMKFFEVRTGEFNR